MEPYLSVFSSSFLALLSVHGQLISSVQTSFLSWLTSRASIRFALTSLRSARMGISQNASLVVFWLAGFSITGEYHGGNSSINPCSRRSSKNRIFKAALCLYRYLVCARRNIQPVHVQRSQLPSRITCIGCTFCTLFGLIFRLLTAKCTDLSLLIDHSTYFKGVITQYCRLSIQSGVCLLEVFSNRN